MKGLKYRITCVVIAIAIALCSVSVFISGYSKSKYSAYTYLSDVTLCSNGNTAYLIGTSENKILVDAVYPDKFSTSFSTNNSPSSYRLCGDTIVALCTSDNETEVYLYNIKSQIAKIITLPRVDGSFINKYVYDGTYFYYISATDCVRKVSENGTLSAQYSTGRDILSLVCDASNNIYAVCDKGLYKLNTNSELVSDATYFKYVEFFSDNYFVDGNNTLYHKNGETINPIGSFVSNNKNKFGGILNNYIITADNNTLYALNNTDCEKAKSCVLSGYIDDLCVANNKVLVLSYNEGVPQILSISFEELKDIPKQNDTSNKISSNTYSIDNNSKIISQIPSHTTVAAFKKCISYEGFDISFLRYDNKELKSGNIGTNTTVTFRNDDETYSYTLSVIGEVTGEGNVNSRDIKAVARFIIGTEAYNEAQKSAADINKNGKLDISDIAHIIVLSKKLT